MTGRKLPAYLQQALAMAACISDGAQAVMLRAAATGRPYTVDQIAAAHAAACRAQADPQVVHTLNEYYRAACAGRIG